MGKNTRSVGLDVTRGDDRGGSGGGAQSGQVAGYDR